MTASGELKFSALPRARATSFSQGGHQKKACCRSSRRVGYWRSSVQRFAGPLRRVLGYRTTAAQKRQTKQEPDRPIWLT